jgi:hypothetical protein
MSGLTLDRRRMAWIMVVLVSVFFVQSRPELADRGLQDESSSILLDLSFGFEIGLMGFD